jgi:hypothetical protein
MTGLRRAYQIFRKEARLHGGQQVIIMLKILIAPFATLVTTKLLIKGVFDYTSTQAIGSFARHNYSMSLISGFMVHAYFNQGYYFFNDRMRYEWYMGTFPLFWMTPCRKWILALGLCGTDIIQCLVLFACGCLVLATDTSLSFATVATQLALCICVLVAGILIGWIRTCLNIASNGLGEPVDIFYLLFIFSSCLYIPKELMPSPLWPIIELHPGYQINQVVREVWANGPAAVMSHRFLVFLIGFAMLALMAHAVWKFFQSAIQERSCA